MITLEKKIVVTTISDILRVSDVPRKAIIPFIRHLAHLEKHCGLKQVCSELSARKAALEAAEPSRFKQHSDGTWVGVWRPISRLALKGTDSFAKALRVLSIYGLFKHPEPTRSDYVNHVRSLLLHPEKELYEDEVPSSERVSQGRRAANKAEYDTQYPLGLTKVPIWDGAKTASKEEYLCTPEDHIRALDLCPGLVSRHYIYLQEIIGGLLPLDHYVELAKLQKRDFVGTMSLLTKDRKYKLRSVVNPHRLIQLALSRFANAVEEDMKALPQCHIYDQAKGAEWVRRKQLAGIRLMSIDLIQASDFLPLKPQMRLARRLYGKRLAKDIDFFEDVQRCFWLTPHSGVYGRFNSGQGAGTRGSIMFSRDIANKCEEVGAGPDDFVIVGDDLVIVFEPGNRLLQKFYRQGILVNYNKSLIDSEVDQFVGRTFVRGLDLNVFKSNWFNLTRDPMGWIRQFGISALYRTRTLSDMPEYIKEKLHTYYSLQQLGHAESVPVDEHILNTLTIGELALIGSELGLEIEVPPPATEGGCPEHLFTAMRDTVPNQTVQLLYSMVGQSREAEAETRRAKGNAWLKGHDSPSFFVKSWEFYKNSKWVVDSFNAERAKLLKARATQRNIEKLSLLSSRFRDSYGLCIVPNLQNTEGLLNLGLAAAANASAKDSKWQKAHTSFKTLKRKVKVWKKVRRLVEQS